MDAAEVRKRVLRVIEQARNVARSRRARVELAATHGERALHRVAAPVATTVARVLTSEGFPFQVATPVGAVRLQAKSIPENFVELDLNTDHDPPALRVRVSRVRGSRVLVDEEVFCEADRFAELTGDEVLTVLLTKLAPFVES